MDLFHGGQVVFGVPVPFFVSNTTREAVMTSPPIRGGTYTVDFYAQPNPLMLVGLGLDVTNLNFPSLGHVYLDPAVSVFLTAFSYTTTTSQPVGVAIPNLPWIVGMTIGMQGLDIDLTSGAMQTTNCPFEVIQ